MTFLSKLMNIGSLDVQYTEEYFEFLTDEDQNNIVDYLRTYFHTDQLNTDVIIEVIFNRINELVFTAIKVHFEFTKGNEKIVEICQKRIDEFTPYLNCIDSHFNNELDDVNIRGRRFTEVVTNVLEALKEIVHNDLT
jgi:hypothetical protein